MNSQYHMTRKSGNAKTGPIPVTTTSDDTCPKTCPFRGSGCYANSGPLKLHWMMVSDSTRGYSFDQLCSDIESLEPESLWRHNQAGDLPGKHNRIDTAKLRKLTEANRGKRGFTYSHKPLTETNKRAIREANENGFTINVSANTLEHADELANAEVGPVVVVLDSDTKTATRTPAGRRVILCPATQRDDIDCARCGLCQKSNPKRPIIGFPAHGNSKRIVSAIATRIFAS